MLQLMLRQLARRHVRLRIDVWVVGNGRGSGESNELRLSPPLLFNVFEKTTNPLPSLSSLS